ncbi:MAG: DUF4282 domain-containing protein [Sulfurovum sp.]|nr:DUF4282 domain-containing protein [Sulfurovum sp.]
MIEKFHLLSQGENKGKQVLSSTLTLKHKAILTSFFIACFLFMQIIWRMMFEFLITFMQIRDALV